MAPSKVLLNLQALAASLLLQPDGLNDDALAAEIVEAGRRSDDHAWQMPLTDVLLSRSVLDTRTFYRSLADAGWLGIAMPERHGGSGLGLFSSRRVVEVVLGGRMTFRDLTIRPPQGEAGVFDGSLTIKRGDFSIGEGAWKAFDIVANDVVIKFRITAAAK